MAKKINVENTELAKEKATLFMDSVDSSMYYKSEVDSDTMSLNWLDELEFACPYIDNIIKNPRMALINEEDIVTIEKAKKIGVASVKNLAKNTHFIDKIDLETMEVQPSKILIERREETYNTYENRFIYTLIDHMLRFVLDKERMLDNFEMKNHKHLEYSSTAKTDVEKIDIEFRITSGELPKDKNPEEFAKEIEDIRSRIKFVQDYLTNWRRSEFVTSLEKARVPFVIPPIRKTNMILKNPNFQIASKLWQFLLNQDMIKENAQGKQSLETTGNEMVRGILDDAFLMSYYVLDSISSRKRDQNEKLYHYGIVMITEQIRRVIEILLNSGYDISEDEIIKMIADEIKNEKIKRTAGETEIKKQFQDEMKRFLKENKKGVV